MGDNLAVVDLGTGAVAIGLSIFNEHTCVVLSDGSLKCWGEMTWGQLGYGTSQYDIGDNPGEMGDHLPAVDLGSGMTATAVAAGSQHTCVLLATKQVKCWGDGYLGKLGSGDRWISG